MEDGKMESTPSYDLSGGFGHASGGSECDLDSIVPIDSIDRSLLSRISLGTTLQVRLETKERKTVICVFFFGQRVGSIVPDPLLGFVKCLQIGVTYTATVVKKDGLCCEVRVRRAL